MSFRTIYYKLLYTVWFLRGSTTELIRLPLCRICTCDPRLKMHEDFCCLYTIFMSFRTIYYKLLYTVWFLRCSTTELIRLPLCRICTCDPRLKMHEDFCCLYTILMSFRTIYYKLLY